MNKLTIAWTIFALVLGGGFIGRLYTQWEYREDQPHISSYSLLTIPMDSKSAEEFKHFVADLYNKTIKRKAAAGKKK